MNVLVISHLYPNEQQPTYGTFVHEQTKELIKQGCNVTVIAPIRYAPLPIRYLNKKWKSYSSIRFKNRIEGVVVYHPRYISFPKGYFFEWLGHFMFFGIKSLVEKLHAKEPFDLIHAHVALPNGMAALQVKEMINVPYIVTIHGQDLQKTIYKNKKCRHHIDQILEKASKIVMVSEKLERIYKEEFTHKNDNHSQVIYNGVNEIFLSESKAEHKYFTTKGPKILSVSNLIPEKGIEYNLLALIELIKDFPSLEYLIVGDGIYQKKLKELVLKYNLQNNVRFLGRKKPVEVKAIMSQCDIFSLPSWQEAFGIVYIEAMASSVPVIGCKGQGIEEVIVENETGLLVEPKSVDELTKAIRHLLTNEDKREGIGKKACFYVLDHFSWEKNVKESLCLYEEVRSTTNKNIGIYC